VAAFLPAQAWGGIGVGVVAVDGEDYLMADADTVRAFGGADAALEAFDRALDEELARGGGRW
jgi:hypothetical protein